MKETSTTSSVDINLTTNENLSYWVIIRSRELKDHKPYIFRDGLSDEDLYYWLRYQADELKKYMAAKHEKTALSQRFQYNEEIITGKQPLVEQDKICFPHGSIHQG
ncbi:hypothetical protein [Xenorhabdus littoralis]|uniref:hypothetical protein n=1 Tax=Xenorhabdus littoralis TaxID=2582835 RepID=UPI0029E7E8F0|nr:hypothetical protein [Xenorhabdus sp. psl]MDX7992540.1 hypothetical protein [Xenorhabdus sp. psl]